MPRSVPAIISAAATAGLLAAAIALAGPAAGSTAAAGRPEAASTALASTGICKSSIRPKLAARLSTGLEKALAGRVSDVGFTVADPRLGLTCAFHQTRHFDSASAIKAIIISALLYKEHGPSHLTSAQRGLAWEMITESDNDAATDLWDEVGMASLQRFLNAAHMTDTILDDGAWGLSQLTAQDELKLLELLATPGKVLSAASRGYALWLMAHVVPSQRWGVPVGAPKGVTVSVKNGWLPDPYNGLWHINSIGVFRGKNVDYEIAVLTSGNPTMAYGVTTIEKAAYTVNIDIYRATRPR
jgi:beta-lactamase class A